MEGIKTVLMTTASTNKPTSMFSCKRDSSLRLCSVYWSSFSFLLRRNLCSPLLVLVPLYSTTDDDHDNNGDRDRDESLIL